MRRRTYLRAIMVGGSAVVGGNTETRSMIQSVEAQPTASWTRRSKLAATDGDSSDRFGKLVALDGDTALIGADRSGLAYVFSKSDNTWTQEARLTADDRLGSAVALDGTTALVGAPPTQYTSDARPGSAYIFERSDDTWNQQAELTVSGIDPWHGFGRSVALDGDTVLIGADDDDTSVSDGSGSVYAFERSNGTWTQQTKLYATDANQHDRFGRSVVLDSDTALIGAYEDDVPNSDQAGSAYVFERTNGTWTQQAKLSASDAERSDWFGLSISLAGDTALIGAPNDDNVNGDRAGSAYVFERSNNTWAQQAKLTADEGDSSDSFGKVALDNDTALIGAHGVEYHGAAYVFERSNSTWSQRAIFSPADADSGDRFGDDVALDGDTALVGASADEDPNGDFAGSAYVFTSKTESNAPLNDYRTDEGDVDITGLRAAVDDFASGEIEIDTLRAVIDAFVG